MVGAASVVGAVSVVAGTVVVTAADDVAAGAGAASSPEPHPAATMATAMVPAERMAASLIRVSIFARVMKRPRPNSFKQGKG